MTNHVLFIHGVNVDEKNYAEELIRLLNLHKKNTTAPVNPIPLWWNDITVDKEKETLNQFIDSSVWNDIGFKSFREKTILQFVGDAAVYLSQHIAAKAISTLHTQIMLSLNNYQESDVLHIVAHSWGSIILFDILFATRWENTDCSCDKRKRDDKIKIAIKEVQEIREKFWGLGKNKNSGIKIGSINTIGSPIAFYSFLIDLNSSHDITVNLKGITGEKNLVWQNFMHRCDVIACPLKKILPYILDKDTTFEVHDFLTNNRFFKFSNPITAHSSYWKSETVAKQIVSQFLPKEML